MHIEENPPYKGGWLEIGKARRRGMNKNTPNPGLALGWLYPLNGVERLSPECQSSTTGDTGHPGLDAGKGKKCEKLPPWRLWLTPEESVWQRLWKKTENSRLRVHRSEKPEGNRNSHHQSPYVFSEIFTCSSGRSSSYGVVLLLI